MTDEFDFEPRWIVAGRKYIGVREIHGPRHESTIVGWLGRLGAWWAEDETPWCGTFVAAMMQECGLPLPHHWYRARAWLDWGTVLPKPIVGAVVVFERGGAGHVGFVIARDAGGRVATLGGNQGNCVSIVPFDEDRVLGYRWPVDETLPLGTGLPMWADADESSKDES